MSSCNDIDFFSSFLISFREASAVISIKNLLINILLLLIMIL